jgi:hypothetical protein
MKWIFGVTLSLFLTACGGETRVADPRPELQAFDIIDSYDTDTAVPQHAPLVLDPYLYDGLFEIFWRVNSAEDYRVSLLINDQPTIANSLRIHSQVCGAGLRCDQSGNWICEYTTDFYLSCDTGEREIDILPLVDKLPQRLYLFMEICDQDSGYCEFDYYPVTFQ